ncbi:MAG: hypothetical protein J6J27_02165 [Alphaproteobacteria bacterium]|nr:hypothetical protein [Alphaproteobacteria bacterium]
MKKLLFISLLALTACGGGGSAETGLPKDIVSPIINGGEITPTTPDTPADPSSQGGNENNGSTGDNSNGSSQGGNENTGSNIDNENGSTTTDPTDNPESQDPSDDPNTPTDSPSQGGNENNSDTGDNGSSQGGNENTGSNTGNENGSTDTPASQDPADDPNVNNEPTKPTTPWIYPGDYVPPVIKRQIAKNLYDDAVEMSDEYYTKVLAENPDFVTPYIAEGLRDTLDCGDEDCTYRTTTRDISNTDVYATSTRPNLFIYNEYDFDPWDISIDITNVWFNNMTHSVINDDIHDNKTDWVLPAVYRHDLHFTSPKLIKEGLVALKSDSVVEYEHPTLSYSKNTNYYYYYDKNDGLLTRTAKFSDCEANGIGVYTWGTHCLPTTQKHDYNITTDAMLYLYNNDTKYTVNGEERNLRFETLALLDIYHDYNHTITFTNSGKQVAKDTITEHTESGDSFMLANKDSERYLIDQQEYLADDKIYNFEGKTMALVSTVFSGCSDRNVACAKTYGTTTDIKEGDINIRVYKYQYSGDKERVYANMHMSFDDWYDINYTSVPVDTIPSQCTDDTNCHKAGVHMHGWLSGAEKVKDDNLKLTNPGISLYDSDMQGHMYSQTPMKTKTGEPSVDATTHRAQPYEYDGRYSLVVRGDEQGKFMEIHGVFATGYTGKTDKPANNTIEYYEPHNW